MRFAIFTHLKYYAWFFCFVYNALILSFFPYDDLLINKKTLDRSTLHARCILVLYSPSQIIWNGFSTYDYCKTFYSEIVVDTIESNAFETQKYGTSIPSGAYVTLVKNNCKTRFPRRRRAWTLSVSYDRRNVNFWTISRPRGSCTYPNGRFVRKIYKTQSALYHFWAIRIHTESIFSSRISIIDQLLW